MQTPIKLFNYATSRILSARVFSKAKTKGSSQPKAKSSATSGVKNLPPPCPPSYDDLPQPMGEWEPRHQQMQMKYNIQLGLSVLFFMGTLITAKVCGFFKLNYYPPDQPGERLC